MERKKNIYNLAHYLPLLEKRPAIFYTRPVQETIPESFLHWLRSQDLTSKELVEILRRCQEEDYMEAMKKAPNHIDPVEVQDTVIVQAVDLNLYDVFIYGKAGAASFSKIKQRCLQSYVRQRIITILVNWKGLWQKQIC